MAATALTRPFRSRGRAEDSLNLKLRVSHLFSAENFEPPGFPPAAILIVKHLPDPLPRGLRPDALHPGATAEWLRAAGAALAERWGRAARPARGYVADSVDAVIFDGPAELLACLARDLRANRGFTHWWWKAILRGLPSSPGEALQALCCREAKYVPAALAQLAEWGEAVDVVRLFSPSQARGVLAAVAYAYQLDGVVSTLRTPATELEIRPLESCSIQESTICSGTSVLGAEKEVAPESPPWEPEVAASAAPEFSGRERQALLGVALLLHRAPHRARATHFVAKFSAWFHAPSRPTPVLPAVSKETAQSLSIALGATLLPAKHRMERELIEESGASEIARARSRRFASPQALRARPGVHPPDDCAASVASRIREIAPPCRSVELAGSGTWTEVGGALFLVHLLRALHLPDALESDFQIRTPLSGWAVLELFARCLLGREHAALASDPLWSVLAKLDGRELTEPPARDFVGSGAYRLPAAWLRAVVPQDAQDVTLSVRDHRLIVWHAFGFPVIDRIFDHIPNRSDIADELARCGWAAVGIGKRTRAACWRLRRPVCTVPSSLRANADLARFLHLAMPFVCWRLLSGLALQASTSSALAHSLLRRRGMLYATSTHVDLLMDLDLATLPVRLAGLDANPGWVPELGRVIAFHYR
jgi:hypothetical protein